MKRSQLALRGLRYHLRAHALVFLGVVLGAAVLAGALLVGDSVRAALARTAEERVGDVDAALVGNDRYFRAGLAPRLTRTPGLEGAGTAALLHARASLSARGGAARVGSVQVLGVDPSFFALAPRRAESKDPGRPRRSRVAPGTLAINRRLAARLDVGVGDVLVLRTERPGELPGDAALATSEDSSLALRREVSAVLDAEDFGSFGLAAAHVPEPTVYLPRQELQEALELEGKSNLLLIGAHGALPGLLASADAALAQTWSLEDIGLVPRSAERARTFELASERIFIESAVGEALAESDVPALGALTWFVNSIECNGRTTPYSVVAGVGALSSATPPASIDPLAGLSPGAGDPAAGPTADPAGDPMPAESIVLNDWLAEDLEAGPGDEVTLRYFTVGANRRLVEASRALTVHAIVPMTGAAADPTWMPDFPGLSDSAHCRDWEPGIPIDLERLRERDEAYWEEHRGTPKAFVGLETARAMWATRFGDLTSIRTASGEAGALTGTLRRELDPERFGLWFQDVRGPAQRAAAPTTDFGVLFLSLSFFLLAGAFLLTGLFFALGVEQRAREVGMLLALGFTPRRVRRQFLGEASWIALGGTLVGLPLGLGYTALVLRGLDSVWSGAVGRVSLELAVEPATLALAALLNVGAALFAIAWAFRRLVRRPAHELLSGVVALSGTGARAAGGQRSAKLVAGAAGLAAASVVVLASLSGSDSSGAAGAFFGAGALALVAGLALARWRLGADGASVVRSRAGLARSNASRRAGRSLATVSCLASGVFLVVAVGSQRSGPLEDPTRRDAGTGGFTLFAESALPVLEDLSSERGQETYGIDAEELAEVEIVPLRVRAGDDASCLNLATPERPRLVGVRPEALAERRSFSFAGVLDGLASSGDDASPWSLLGHDLGPDVVPGIADAASVTWALHRALGDDIEYRDDSGRPFSVRIVATLQGSMLQGDLLIAEPAFEARFPLESGYRALLVDTPLARARSVSETLSRSLGDLGLAVTPSGERLAGFLAVQDTYISIFQLLGALGVLLGCAGLGVVVSRNANERRGELAALRAIGFSRASVWRLLWMEHARLLGLGVVVGVAAAALALVPSVRTQSGAGWTDVGWLIAGVAGIGALSVGCAAWGALRGAALGVLSRDV